jgi:5-methylcytosine-specific restriction endonuclease McrBC regulatory subunit McrC
VRGHVVPLSTATAFYQGRIAIDCQYEEFDVDNPLNRLLLAALRAVTANTQLDRELRRRARRLRDRFDAVGSLKPDDLQAVVDLRTRYYKDAIALARHVLSRSGLSVHEGGAVAWSFLFPTPRPIEAGVRQLLSDELSERWYVSTDTRRLWPSRLRLHPDLVFDDGYAVADIKYKLASGRWLRPDLYQVATYAAGYKTRRSAIIAFGRASDAPPSPLHVGDVMVQHFLWDINALTPDAAADHLRDEVTDWLASDANLTDDEVLKLVRAAITDPELRRPLFAVDDLAPDDEEDEP